MTDAPRAIFDLDGTLIDSVHALRVAGLSLLAELGREPVDVATYKGFVGKGQKVQVERLLTHTGGIPDGGVEPWLEKYRAAYDPRAGGAGPYPGAVAALRALADAGWRIGVCTQKPEAKARLALEAFGFDMVETVVGGDSIPGALKPDPRLLERALAPLGAGEAIYVGDSETDAETAEAGGLPFILHLNGYRHSSPDALLPAARFDDWADLPAIAAQVVAEHDPAG